MRPRIRPRGVGLPWFEEGDYTTILELMIDRTRLPKTFAGWEMRQQAAEQIELARNIVVHRAIIKPDSFREWCAVMQIRPNASARNIFASRYAEVRSQKAPDK